MRISESLQINDGHLHAWSLFVPISWKHFLYLGGSILVCKLKNGKSLTTHLPLELQHNVYKNTPSAHRLVRFGNHLAALFKVKLYWENAPLLNYGTWDMKRGQTNWELVPRDIPLCLDVGHLMLGSASATEARTRILSLFNERREQIKHLHIHENDLVHDSHGPIYSIIDKELLKTITAGSTFIFEK